MECIGQLVGFLFALFLLRLAYKVFEKNIPQSSFIALLAVVILFCSFPWFQGFVKTWINSKVNSKLEAIGQQVNEVQKTTTEMHGQLENHDWPPRVIPLLMRQFPVVSVCCFASTQGSGGRRA
jgi:hypothetical protein